MDLEKMRFEEQFDYKIEVSNEIDKDYDEIPSMLLQPYVENAIWHGLMSKKGKGLIKIEIRGEGEYICCSVEDNGIGRKAAAVIKAKRNIKQKSVGMSITKERLDLMSDNDINLETIDLYNDNEEAVGTKMLIRIQYKT
jgi:sensor histidine kinase YesM